MKTRKVTCLVVNVVDFFDFSCGILEHCPWLHGSVFVNNFNVGRYHKAGPQQTLYIPGPLLHEGDNEVSYCHI